MKKFIVILLTITFLACEAPNKKEPAQSSEDRQTPEAIESFYRAFNTGDTTAFLNVAAENFTDKMQEATSADGGKGGVVYAIKVFRIGYPDLKIEIEKMWKDGNGYVCKTRITGTNTGSLFGTAATNKPVSFSAIDAFEIVDEKIVNLWHIEQIDKMKQQLTK